jgi:hypothetical protein
VSAQSICSLQFIKKGEPWNKALSFPDTEEKLLSGDILSIKPLGESQAAAGMSVSGSMLASLITLDDGTKGVFKPYRTISDEAETDAYVAAKLIGSKQVPPTVTREINGVRGSVQLYVKTSIDLVKDDDLGKEIIKLASERDLADRKIFYFVFGQWDATLDNVFIDDSLTLVLIDNNAISSLQKNSLW